MLPTNIDLTENRDFSGGNAVIWQIDIEIPEDWEEIEILSSDQWKKICEHEKIFGRKRHVNQKDRIFDWENSNRLNLFKTHCARCGKEFRIPWDNLGGICRKCDSEVEVSNYDRIPWKRFEGTWNPRNDPKEIFNLR